MENQKSFAFRFIFSQIKIKLIIIQLIFICNAIH